MSKKETECEKVGAGREGEPLFFFLTLRTKCKLEILDKFGQEKKHHSFKVDLKQ